MSILDDVMVNAKSAVDIVGKKAEKLVDYSKIKYSISNLNSEISKKFEALGRFMFDASESNEKPDESVIQEKFQEIRQLNEQLEEAKKLLAVAKNKKVCPVCNAENEKNALFCSKCGYKFEEETDETENSEESNDKTDDKTDNDDQFVEISEEEYNNMAKDDFDENDENEDFED